MHGAEEGEPGAHVPWRHQGFTTTDAANVKRIFSSTLLSRRRKQRLRRR
jgi:hypothetical protein